MLASIVQWLASICSRVLLTFSVTSLHSSNTLSDLEAGTVDRSAFTIPITTAHQPLMSCITTPHPSNAKAASRLLLRVKDLRTNEGNDGLTTSLADEALQVAMFMLYPMAPCISNIRQTTAEVDVAHPFIRVRATSRDAKVITPLPVYVFVNVDYPFGGFIALDNVVSVWLAGRSGPQLVGSVTNMQPMRDSRILYHLRGINGYTVGFVVGPAESSYMPDFAGEFAEYRCRAKYQHTYSAETPEPPSPAPYPIESLFGPHECDDASTEWDYPHPPSYCTRSTSASTKVSPFPSPLGPLPPLPDTPTRDVIDEGRSTVPPQPPF